MLEAIGSTLSGFVIVTMLLGCGCAFMTGQAIAITWRPLWQVVAYTLLLAAADRFLHFALFNGALLNPGGYLVDALLLEAVALAAFLATRARKMVTQYPWHYARRGLFAWRERQASLQGEP